MADCSGNFSQFRGRNLSCVSDPKDVVLIQAVFISLVVLKAAIGALATVGNALVVITFAKYKFLQTGANSPLLSLALSDLLAGLTILMDILLHTWPDAEAACVAISALYFTVYGTQIWTLLLITVDRWLSITYALRSRQILSSRMIAWILVGIWLVMVILSSVSTYDHSWSQGDYCHPFTVLNFIVIVYSLSSLVIPAIAIPVLYIKITKVAARHRRDIKNLASYDPRQHQTAEETRSVRTLSRILGLFSATWLPVILAETVKLLPADTLHTALALEATSVIATICLFISSVLNPLVYHRSSADVRRAFFMLMCPRRYRRHQRREYLETISGRLPIVRP